MFEKINPATGKLIGNEKSFSRAEVELAFERAEAAFRTWKNRELRDRSALLAKFRASLKEEADKGAVILSEEMGKPVHQAKGEILASLARIDWFLRHTPGLLSERPVSALGTLSEHIAFEPLGVVGNISAWNFPYFIGINVLVPALLTGNTVLYKPSEHSSGTGRFIGELLARAGVPGDVFQVLTGTGETGRYLCEQNLGGMFFTGSVPTGQKIARSLAERMIPAGFELGGKDPAYVCDDADVQACVETVSDGAFYNAGQSCCSVERIYVHKKIAQEFCRRFLEAVRGMKVGNPQDPSVYMGPLARKEQMDVLDDQIQDARKKGATCLAEGGRMGGPGNFYRPVVLTGVNSSMKIMKEESFGPVVGIQEVADDGEAISLMNDSEFGLTASVHTPDRERATNILRRLEAGTVYWNCCDRVSAELPWSGRKMSGLGSTLSEPGLRAFVQPKAWHMRYPQK